LKNLFRTDPDASLQAAQAAIVTGEELISQLQIRRAQLVEAEEGVDLNAIAKVDRDIETARAGIAVHRDRIAAFEVKRRQQNLARLEQEKTTGIVDVRGLFNEQVGAYREIDALLAQLKKAFAHAGKVNLKVKTNWPASVSPLGLLPHFDPEILEPLSAAVRQRRSVGEVRHVAEHEPYNFAAAVEALHSEAIDLLEGAPIKDEIQEDAA
jgi:hypothetical protein